ncbi:MAG: FecR domain-containing protein [Duncaniella sp.]|uniref:FecR family protein n=1 Tax=Duncaniella sp. TaxID=2518496 RepID=UPI0023BEFDFF|nr:FecR domain-containing protein [Duncaniella sp.]MDE5988662.1 FecR domain-containing protein [Duncaniella sp.]
MDNIKQLLYRHAIGITTPEEERALIEWADGNQQRLALLQRLADPDYIADRIGRREMIPVERPMADMRRRISRTRRLTAVRAIAASVTLLLTLASTFIIYIYVSHPAADAPMSVSTATPQPAIDIAGIHPGTTHAKLTLASDTTLELSATDTICVASSILRSGSCDINRPAELCLDVPRGAEFKIILEDSTQVWLNSESTLRYPEVFSPTERRVQVSGEAYFSVAKDENRPFYVETGEQTVRVYGTEFNVRDYADAPCVYTTLERGSIAITRSGLNSGEVMLSAGHQACLSRSDNTLNLRVVNPAVITSWRHGRFVFEEQPLASIMRDLSRWYDFSYEFADPQLEQIVFMGSIPRYADFATAISIIEKSGGLRFTTQGDKVVISPRQ